MTTAAGRRSDLQGELSSTDRADKPTIAQTGQVFDVFHRPGNVHDSNGAQAFILACINAVREALPGTAIEVRMDGAFFSDTLVTLLADLGVEFTISVPFERFVELKSKIERRRWWQRLGQGLAYFELRWKPKAWSRRYRFVFVRTLTAVRDKGPVQLDLFAPQVYGYEFKVVVTNKKVRRWDDGLFVPSSQFLEAPGAKRR